MLEQMRKKVNISDAIYDEADRLTPFSLAGRYPSEIYFDQHVTGKAIKSAEAILNWVKSELPGQDVMKTAII